jgi:hypothetical protein
VLDYFFLYSEPIFQSTDKTHSQGLGHIFYLPPEIITEAAGTAADVVIQHNAVNLISDANIQVLKRPFGEKIGIARGNFIMVRIFIKGLKPEFINEMITTSWVSLAQTFDRPEELEKHAEQNHYQHCLCLSNILSIYLGDTLMCPLISLKCN